MRNLTPVAVAGLLDAAYLADQGEAVNAPRAFIRAELADCLGCDAELREDVWWV